MNANPVARTFDAATHGLRGALRVYSRLPKARDADDVFENLVAAAYFGWATASSYLFDEAPEDIDIPEPSAGASAE